MAQAISRGDKQRLSGCDLPIAVPRCEFTSQLCVADVTTYDCGASAWGQALQVRLLRFQIEPCCCYDCGGITCGTDYAVMIIDGDCGA